MRARTARGIRKKVQSRERKKKTGHVITRAREAGEQRRVDIVDYLNKRQWVGIRA